jgi:hypothetical protein
MNIVILGSARSGTSIFGELFELLPGFRYYFEPGLERLSALDYDLGPIAVKMPRAADVTRTTPGLAFLLEEMVNIVRDPFRILWQVRHPLDAICSLRVGIQANWAHGPRPQEWETLRTLPLIEQCAHYWAYVNGVGFQAVRDRASVYRYEDMIVDPRGAAVRACKEAEVDGPAVEAAVERWCSLVSNDKSPDAYEAKHQVRWSRLDHSARTGRWRENLSPDDIRLALPIVSKAAHVFGYELAEANHPYQP